MWWCGKWMVCSQCGVFDPTALQNFCHELKWHALTIGWRKVFVATKAGGHIINIHGALCTCRLLHSAGSQLCFFFSNLLIEDVAPFIAVIFKPCVALVDVALSGFKTSIIIFIKEVLDWPLWALFARFVVQIPNTTHFGCFSTPSANWSCACVCMCASGSGEVDVYTMVWYWGIIGQ